MNKIFIAILAVFLISCGSNTETFDTVDDSVDISIVDDVVEISDAFDASEVDYDTVNDLIIDVSADVTDIIEDIADLDVESIETLDIEDVNEDSINDFDIEEDVIQDLINDDACIPNCDNINCGTDDGCGGICGCDPAENGAERACVEGTCECAEYKWYFSLSSDIGANFIDCNLTGGYENDVTFACDEYKNVIIEYGTDCKLSNFYEDIYKTNCFECSNGYLTPKEDCIAYAISSECKLNITDQ